MVTSLKNKGAMRALSSDNPPRGGCLIQAIGINARATD